MSKVTSLKHTGDKRAHIPSKEEAGMENANEQVMKKNQAHYPLNPIMHRGQDPELFWLNKYRNDDREELLKIDIRSLYRHEHISPELLINNLYKIKEGSKSQLDMFSLFGNTMVMDELEKVADYYKYSDDWKNRLIQGDSLLVMASLLEREGMAGKVQTVFFDPPYGIKYSGNWQIKISDIKMSPTDNDDALSGEPEQIKAFRDTWIDGIHSYLSYLRDRLIIARELLSETGSCFIQISDENVHLVRNILDEVFGSDNFISLIPFRKKTMPFGTNYIEQMADFIIWYGKGKTSREGKPQTKYRALTRQANIEGEFHHCWFELPDGNRHRMTQDQINNHSLLPGKARVYRLKSLEPSGVMQSGMYNFEFEGRIYKHPKNGYGTSPDGMRKLVEKKRIQPEGNRLTFIMYADENSAASLTAPWYDTIGADNKEYVVQTNTEVIRRCILMTTDPGDLVLDPTCGSGTTAYVAEQWGRRWITIDTSRIALNIAKSRLMTAVFPYYELYDYMGKDIRQGFIYKTVPHVTLKSLANDEPAEEQTLYDQPKEDKRKLRVSGTFTVETLQNFEPIPVDILGNDINAEEEVEHFELRIFEHLKSAGVKNGIKNENAVFKRVEHKNSAYLHAEGFYHDTGGKERKAYIHIGPKFGTVSKQAVNEAVKECRGAGDADWLIILGFSFEADIQNQNVTTSAGSFEVTKVRMHDDLMQEGLLKRDKKAASFVTIGEPDIKAIKEGKNITIEIQGLDIYDPIMDEVKARSVSDIAYWMVDDDYDSSNFIVKQVFFCGGDKDEFDKL